MRVCNWCGEEFETHAKLYIHHLSPDGIPNCPKHPDIKPKLEYGDGGVWK